MTTLDVDVEMRGEAARPHAPGASSALAELDISVVMPCLDEAGSVGSCVVKALEGIPPYGPGR